ncbi:MAG: CoA-binding protein [Thermoanaerobaculaceae bacterium]|nr:CoA-binding protein [Thermoanaerobaculaceae bacterium]TAM45999.1 MAG: CoA-binding protein [Acidobacteriota bacterium]
MVPIPQPVAEFLAGHRIAVAGVSRAGNAPANAIFRKLRDCGHEVIPVNPAAAEIEGVRCFPDLASVPDPIHGVMVVTHPAVSAAVARAAVGRGIEHVWFHRSFGAGSVSPEAVRECRAGGVEPIVGGCPLMYCRPVDVGHRCFRWWLRLRHRVPG